MQNKQIDAKILELNNLIEEKRWLEDFITSISLKNDVNFEIINSTKNKGDDFKATTLVKEKNKLEILIKVPLKGIGEPRIPDSVRRKIISFKYKYDKSNKKETIEEKFNVYKNKLIYHYKKDIANARTEIRRLEGIKKWNNLDPEIKKDRETDLTFYQSDTTSYWLSLSVIAFDIVYLIVMLSVMERTFWIGAFILANIAYLLFLFTTAIKLKNYVKLFSYLLIVFGAYCAFRVSIFVPFVMNVPLYGSISIINKLLIFGTNIYATVVSIYVGVTSLEKIKRQEKYLKEGKISFKQMSK